MQFLISLYFIFSVFFSPKWLFTSFVALFTAVDANAIYTSSRIVRTVSYLDKLSKAMNFHFGKVFRTKEPSTDAGKVEEALEATTLNTDENAVGDLEKDKELKRLLVINFQASANSRLGASFPTVVQANFAFIDSQVQKLRLSNTKLKTSYEQAIEKCYQSPSRELKGISQSFDKTLGIALDTLESLKGTAKILQQLEEALSATPPLRGP